MKVKTLSYQDSHGWREEFPLELDSSQTMLLVFGSPSCLGVDHALAELRAAFPRSIIKGCSTAGEIQANEVLDGTLSVTVIHFEKTQLAAASVTLANPDESYAAGVRLAEQFEPAGLRAVLLISDGLGVNGSQLVQGLNSGLWQSIPVFGGLAGDGAEFSQTWIFSEGKRHNQHVLAVGLYGDALKIGVGSGGGWSEFGPERQITRAMGQVLYELDGEPALKLYKHYLGDLAAGLPGTALRFPLRVKAAAADAEDLVRTILSVDEAAQSLTFAGDIPEGGTACLMRANQFDLIDGASDAVERAALRAGLNGTEENVFVLSVSCVGRRMLMGQNAEEELEVIVRHFPLGCTHAGFYSYGEIAPAASSWSRLHNQTIAVTIFAET